MLLLLLLLSGGASAWWWDSAPTPAPAMVEHTMCGTVNFTRTNAWQCFINMGDGKVAGHAKDGDLDYEEVKYGIKTHLTVFETLVGPSASGVMERCDAGGDNVVQADEFANSQRPSCIGTASDLCHVHGVCAREFPADFV
jgi:hypothetical protein